LASGRQYGNALLGVRHQEEELDRRRNQSCQFFEIGPSVSELQDPEKMAFSIDGIHHFSL